MVEKNPSISAKGQKILAAFEAHKKTRVDRKNVEKLKQQMKAEEQKAINTLRKNAVTQRAKQHFEETFGKVQKSNRTLQDTVNTFKDQLERVKDIQKKAKKRQEEQEEVLAPFGGGFTLGFGTFGAEEAELEAPTDEIELVQNLELATLQQRIDKLFDDIIGTDDVRGLNASDIIKLEAKKTELETLQANRPNPPAHISGSRRSKIILAHANKVNKLRTEIALLEKGAKILGSIHLLFQQKINQLNLLVAIPVMSEGDIQTLKDRIQEASRLIENVLSRQITIDAEILKDLQVKMAEAAQRVATENKKKLQEQAPIGQKKLKEEFDLFGSIAKTTEGFGQFIGDNLTGFGEELSKAFSSVFNPTVEEAADQFVKMAAAQQLAQQRLAQ